MAWKIWCDVMQRPSNVDVWCRNHPIATRIAQWPPTPYIDTQTNIKTHTNTHTSHNGIFYARWTVAGYVRHQYKRICDASATAGKECAWNENKIHSIIPMPYCGAEDDATLGFCALLLSLLLLLLAVITHDKSRNNVGLLHFFFFLLLCSGWLYSSFSHRLQISLCTLSGAR